MAQPSFITQNSKTAVVTGACSGIGLGLVQHLLAKPDWRVVLADIRPDAYITLAPTFDQQRTLFVCTDVASWSDNAALFKQAYEWSSGRIDFFAANAGTGDKEAIAQHFDLDAEPVEPNLACLDVNQTSVFYGLKLFIHYARKTKKALEGRKGGDGVNAAAGAPSAFNPKMVITASCTALYPFPVAPQYNASKHALLGLTRAVGPNLLASDNIAVNCIMPAYVATNLTPPGLNEAWPKEWITPLSTMMRAYDELTDESGRVAQDGLSDGKDSAVKTGQAVECVVEKLFYRVPVPYADESQRFLIEQSMTADGLWVQALTRLIESGQLGVQQKARG